MQLIDRQCTLERCSLRIVGARDAVRLGQVHPQRWLGCSAFCSSREIFDRLGDVAIIKRVQPEFVEGERIGLGQGLSAQ